MIRNKKVILLILDGWGVAPPDKFNAIANAKTPNIDRLIRDYPNTQLLADGINVGLPEGQTGTSEVNHMTIGAGKIILQDLPKINSLIKSGEFRNNSALNNSINHALINEGNLHLVGILSDGGVHSHINHLFEILRMLEDLKFSNQVYLHIFTDGRDAPPRSAARYLRKLDKLIGSLSINISIATIQGRFYLDRDRDWDKTKQAVDLIVKGKGISYSDWQSVLNFEYNQNNSDEFLPQCLIDPDFKYKSGDSAIFFHYRTDRLFQIVKDIDSRQIPNVNLTTFISVSESLKKVEVAFPRDPIYITLAEVISRANKTQLHVTETEKFPHLTFFLNGEREEEFPLENWSIVDSNRFVKPYYNFEPSMRNFEIAKIVIGGIVERKYDFIIANLCSADMVGHTGNYEAAVVSAESVDYAVGRIYEEVKSNLDQYSLIITADHGNSDVMWDYKNNQPHTQHTLSPVPFILISDLDIKLHRRESLQDVAPTILDLMGLEKPHQMTGESLII